MENQETERFVAYEYLTVVSRNGLDALYKDCYKSLGWEIDSIAGSVLRLKRNRRIPHRSELCSLQAQCEKALQTVDQLEHSRGTLAMSVALIVGLVGTAFMAGSVFAYLAGLIGWCAVLAVPGFLGWILPYFLYKKVKKNSAPKIDARIDDQYEILTTACEKASALLS